MDVGHLDNPKVDRDASRDISGIGIINVMSVTLFVNMSINLCSDNFSFSHHCGIAAAVGAEFSRADAAAGIASRIYI